MIGFVMVPIQSSGTFDAQCKKTLNEELSTYKILDNTCNFETAKDYDIVWTEKSIIKLAEKSKHFLDYDLEGLKSLIKEYKGYGIIFYSLFDNSDLAEVFPSRQDLSGNLLATLKDFCDAEQLDYSTFNFVTPGFEKYKTYPFKTGTLDYVWAGSQGVLLHEDIQNFDESNIMNNKQRMLCFHHLNWRTHRSLFLYILEKLNKDCLINGHLSYWSNYQYSGNYLGLEVRNLRIIFEGDKFYDTLNEQTLQIRRGHPPAESVSTLRQQPANSEVKESFLGVAIQADPNNTNMRVEEQVFKGALYNTPYLMIGSQGIMRKFNDHYQMDIFEDLWEIGGGLSKIDKLPKAEQRIRAGAECISQMYKNFSDVKKWFGEDKNLKRLRLNRRRVIEVIKKNNALFHNQSEALPILEALGNV